MVKLKKSHEWGDSGGSHLASDTSVASTGILKFNDGTEGFSMYLDSIVSVQIHLEML
jgi:hypothetical protein